jgi:4-hydroxy-3-polyprenylbenzoate decarboxylase
MAYKNLADFIKKLEQDNLLLRVQQPINPCLEMTEIQLRLLKKGGVAVLFENPVDDNGTPYDMPVLVNLFGTVERVALGMGITPDKLRDFGKILAALRHPTPPAKFSDALEMVPLVKSALNMPPKIMKSAPCQQIVLKGDDIDLTKLPIQTCWPGEPAPLITWPLVVTKGPDAKNDPSDNYNLGIYRMQFLDKKTTLMRWLKHRGGAQHHHRWKNKNTDPLPVAVVIGADPATIIAAVTPVPDNMSEYHFSGFMRGKRLNLVKCKTIDMHVPAEAEIILEGHVSLDDYGDEGPYGDHTGYYNAVEKFPKFHISAITMRKNPIYLSTFTGRPPDEPSVLGEALNEVFIPILQQQFPEICDFYLPPEGCSYRISVVAIKKAYPGHAKRVMMGIWSYLRQFVYTKWIIVVDDTINCRDWKDVMWAVSTKMDPMRDITMVENTPIDYLDFASVENGLGSKIGLDATDKWPPETKREWGQEMRMSQNVVDKIDSIWDELNLDTTIKS